mmetsp:Transcript_1908/g.2720  ORF Transcript_1908/g.2720 Transcript_1908/m.2720 type:complete len:266 (+) Transcript_1908:103-900(+)
MAASWGSEIGKIVLFGDSLTQQSFDEQGCWGALLASRYARRADILNRGFSGYNTKWGLKILEHSPSSFPSCADLVLIFFGANDARLPDETNIQHVPIDEYGSNLKEIVKAFQNLKSKHIVLVTPPPLNEEQWANRDAQNGTTADDTDAKSRADRQNEITKKYAEKCKSVAAELGLKSVDLWESIDSSSENFSDGVHFSEKGSKLVYQSIVKIIGEFIPELVVEFTEKINSSSSSDLKQCGPWWDQINDNLVPDFINGSNKKQRTQ